MRIFKFIGKFFLVLILLIIILWTIILSILQTKRGQEWAFNQVKSYFERTTQTKIQVKKFSFSFPLNFGLEDVVLLQDNRPILSVKKFELCCAYTTLLQGRIVFSRLQATNVNIFEIPNQSDSSTQKSAQPWEIPPLPLYVKFENVDIRKLKFNPRVIDSLHLPQEIEKIAKQASFNLNGLISNNPFKSALTAHLLITARSDLADLTPLSLGVDTQNHQLSLSFHFNHLPLQMLQPNLPSHLKAHFALYASAPVSAWQKLAQDPSHHNEPIEGHFKLTLHSLQENDSTPLSALIGQQTVLRCRYLLTSNNAIELVNLKVDNPNFSLIGGAIINSDQIIDRGHLYGEASDLARFEKWLGKGVQGKFAFEGQASGPLLSPLFIMHLESPHLLVAEQSFQNIYSTLQIKPQNKNLNGSFTLSFNYQGIPCKAASLFDWNDQKKITLSHLQIDALRAQLQGEVTYSAPDFIWEGFLEAHTSNLNDLSPFLAVPINGEGQLKLQLAAVTSADHQKRQGFHAELMGGNLRWMDWQAQQLIFHLHMDPLANNANVFQMHGSLNGKQMKWKDYSVGQYAAHFSQKIDVVHRNLNHLSTKWEARDIQWPTGKVAEATGEFQLQNPLQAIEGQIEFAAHQIQTPTMQLKELTGSTIFHPAQAQWPFRLKGNGAWKEDLLFAVEGNWHYQQEKLEVQAQHLSGRFGPYPLQLKQPVHFSQHAHNIQLAGLWLQWGEAEIQADFHQDQQSVSSRFKTNAVPSELFHFIAPDLPLTGRATFEGQIEGAIHQPKGHLQIDLHQIQIIEDKFAKKPFIAGKLLLDLNEKGIQLQSKLNGIGHTPLLIAGQLPINLSFDPFSFKVNPRLPFNLDLNAEGEVDPYLHLFYNDTANISGHAKIALKLNGQMNAPQIKGHIDLINGAYESLSTGALYHNIQAHLEGDGSKVILTKLSAQDNKNGQISAAGVVHLDASKQFPFEFQIHPSRIFILDSDYVDIVASGRLNLIGDTRKSKLQGELNVDQATIRLEETLPHQIKKIDIKYINVAQGDPIPHRFEKSETSSPLELDVKINALQNIRMQGNHLKSEWKGSLVVTGTPENPQLHGDLRISQGEYNFRGKVFTLSQGNIHFAGAPDKKTSLYIVASKDLDRITAEIIVKGPTSQPAISFRSNPPLSQREVLSYILFNRGISDITPNQGDQLSQSFISLNSNEQTRSSDDFLSRLRNNIGLDHLDFTANANKENKEFGLQVGKHITENVTVSVNQGMTSLSPVIAVEAKLRKNLKAQAEAGVVEDAPIRMFIKWKKDY